MSSKRTVRARKARGKGLYKGKAATAGRFERRGSGRGPAAQPANANRPARGKPLNAKPIPAPSDDSEVDPMDYKVKVSVSLSHRQLAYVNERAEALGTTASGVIQDALELSTRKFHLERLLETIGGDGDITDEDMNALYAQWRAAGLNV
jgi:hypothetical protein